MPYFAGKTFENDFNLNFTSYGNQNIFTALLFILFGRYHALLKKNNQNSILSNGESPVVQIRAEKKKLS